MSMRSVGLLFLAALTTAGCFSSTTVVRVRADGSGTIEVTAAVRKAALAQLGAIGEPAGGERKAPRLEDWFPESEVRAAASRLGNDVRFISSRAVDNRDELGIIALYEFSNVRRVTLEPIPMLPAEGGYSSTARLDGEHRFTFDLLDEPENGRVLVVRMPDARIEHDGLHFATGEDEGMDAEQAAQFRTFVGGGRLEVTVELEQPIIRTNTPHRNGQRVTLVRLDAEPLLLDAKTPKRLLLQPGSLDELRYRLHDAPGVTVGLEREIRIEVAARRRPTRTKKQGRLTPAPKNYP
jgi:hypothetical protein